MAIWFKQIIAPPVFENEDQTRKAKLLNTMQLILLGVMVSVIPILLFLDPRDALTNLSLLVPPIGTIIVLLYLLRRGHIEFSGMLLMIMLWLVITINSWIYGGIRNGAHNSYFIIVAIASLLWGARATLSWGGWCLLTTGGLYMAELNGLMVPFMDYPPVTFGDWFLSAVVFGIVILLLAVGAATLNQALNRTRHNEQVLVQRTAQLAASNTYLETEMLQRQQAQEENEHLQQQIIEAQRQALKELSTPIIPVMDHIIVLPLVGSIDSLRARDITRSLLAGISHNRAKVVILDVTGVPVIDSGVAAHLNRTIQAARLKGARLIITGISDAVAEAIIELGIDWSGIETLSNLQTGLVAALGALGVRLSKT
ncbi:MAG: STAS domain-containing protein [Anaerolineae bacterium]|nr:STAS domain-containing protein [Anaerolineae bacterium]